MTDISIFGRLPAALPKVLADKAVKQTLKAVKRPGKGGLGLVIVDEKRMKELNKERRGRASATDVLSFSPAEFPGRRTIQPGLGDIMICPAYVRRDAAKNGTPYPRQLLRVLVHGVLHLSGFDHATAADEKKMSAAQEKIIKACGV